MYYDLGYQRACELVFTGRNLSAKECKELGLVNQIVPSYEVTNQIHILLLLFFFLKEIYIIFKYNSFLFSLFNYIGRCTSCIKDCFSDN